MWNERLLIATGKALDILQTMNFIVAQMEKLNKAGTNFEYLEVGLEELRNSYEVQKRIIESCIENINNGKE